MTTEDTYAIGARRADPTIDKVKAFLHESLDPA